MFKLSLLVSSLFDLITFVLLLGVLLSWIPNIQWHKEPFRTIKLFCDFFFAPFRNLIPPINGIDISPIFIFIIIGVLGRIIVEIIQGIGL